MTRKYFAAGSCLAAVLALAIAPRSLAQAAPASTAPSAATTPAAAATTTTTTTTTTTGEQEEVVKLNPFVVEASEDAGSYQATSTLASTRVRTDLKDVASAISVVTEQFLKDTGAKNSEDLLVYTPSTEVAGLRGNFSAVAGNGIYQEDTVDSTTRVRGLDNADNTRDYFLTDIPWDGFNVGRVDLQRGPNSVLFGIGSPAGIINTSLNDATFKTAYHLENRVDQFGSVRNEIDLNQNIIPGVLSIRVAALKDNEVYEQKPAYNNSTRHYVALRFDPKLFSESSHTSIRVKYEDGNVSSNNPRDIPPGDDYSIWFRSGTDQWGNPGYNKIILNQFNPAQVFDNVAYPGGKGGTLYNGLALTNETRSFWQDVINYYEATPYDRLEAYAATYKAETGLSWPFHEPSGTPIKTIVAQPNTDLGLRYSGSGEGAYLDPVAGGTLGDVNSAFLPIQVPMYSAYMNGVGKVSGFPGYSGNSQLSSVPGSVFYANNVIRDPSVFDFYTKLLDGPNKHEWKNWKAFNISIDQSFFNDRLAFQLAFDHQNYTEGADRWMTGENYAISIDVNATYANGTSNPNAGRPFAGNAASAPSLNYIKSTIRDGFRFTPTYEFHFSDVLGDTTLAKILGKHVFTGLYDQNNVTQDYLNFAEFATTDQYIVDNFRNDSTHTPATGALGSNQSYEWIAYLAPPLFDNPNGKKADLNNVQFNLAPPQNQTALNFNARWNMPTNPTAAGYVNPLAPFSYVNPVTGLVVNGTQCDNPANYVGWTQQPITWLYASNPQDFPKLVENANRVKYKDDSEGITWQAYLFDGDLVPTFGWRKDTITNYTTTAQQDPINHFVSLAYPDDPTSRTDVRGESKTWGIVYHLPKVLTSKLPGQTEISFFYDRGRNFKADAAREDLEGNPIPNSTGNTLEYGINITTFNNKLTLKLDKYRTTDDGATLADTEGNSIGGMGQNAYVLADGAIWGYGWATYLQDAARNNGTGSYGAAIVPWGFADYAAYDGYTRNNDAQIAAALQYNLYGGHALNRDYNSPGIIAISNAWVDFPVNRLFFSSMNLSPGIDPTLGKASGVLHDSWLTPINEASGPEQGGGSNFGDHCTTVDTLSKGYEAELTYQPTKNWNITINFTKTHAFREAIDPTSIAFMSAQTAFFNNTPGGQLRWWYAGDTTMSVGQWNQSLVAGYTLEQNELGHQVPEMSPWRLNMVSTYRIDHGFAKGLYFGGGFREEAGRIVGYHFNSNFVNATTTDPSYANVAFLTLGGLDVNAPFVSKNEWHFDAWLGYSKKLSRTVDWNIQLNAKNVGEHDRLYTGRINPDGNIALARISEGMGLQLTNSLDF